MPGLSVSTLIEAPVEEVYDAFADLTRWPEILPDTVSVSVSYFDGYNQEFSMTVERPGGLETIRGVRYCRAPYELELVQMVPPPGFARMGGRWRFAPCDGGTRVEATRLFEVQGRDGLPADEVAVHLARILAHNLKLFREAVESDG
jgi:ribosome-associated toxin RatA of RatAB toxin-antitoxin module